MTTTMIGRLPGGKWQLKQIHDTLTSLMTTLDAIADLGEQVAVELVPSATIEITGDLQPGPAVEPEPWDGVFREGDEGLTRDGRPYCVKSTSSEYVYHVGNGACEQPIVADVFTGTTGHGSNHGHDGRFLGESEHGRDLMPPTKRGPKP